MEKGPPTIEEGRRRLDTLFEDFITRGADPEFTALLIFTYGVTETINYAKTVEDGISKIDEILNSEFGMEKEIIFTPEFTPEKDPKQFCQAYLTKDPLFSRFVPKYAKTGVVLSECRKTLTREKVVAVGFRRFVRVFGYP